MRCSQRGVNTLKLYEAVKNRKEKLAVIGLGYVGLPLAVAFSKVCDVVAFDKSSEKIAQYLRGIDVTKEVGDEALKNSTAFFTTEEKHLRKCKFHVIAVPTPIHKDKTPDLRPLIDASETVGRNLVKGSIVVFESTVYPGVSEEVCVPILEKESGLTYMKDFKIGYSPERINPGDQAHRLETITKVVSATDEASLGEIAMIYEMIIKAGVYRAESIKVAEAAKVIENSQRDVNIAFMNELAIIFNKMGINTKAVLDAAKTKWNFTPFTPGLVGGHCIGVDPYYLTYKAAQLGYHSQIILSSRKINDGMGKYVAEHTVKKLIAANKQINGAKIAIFGVTFKENCPDVRNTKVIDIIHELHEYGMSVSVFDPVCDKEQLWREHQIYLVPLDEITDMDAIIFAVGHDTFASINLETIKTMYRHHPPVLIDVKGIFDRKEAEYMNFLYWSL